MYEKLDFEVLWYCLVFRLYLPTALSKQDNFSLRPTFLWSSLLQAAVDTKRMMPGQKAETISILHFNDVYNVESREIEPVGGAARLVALLFILKIFSKRQQRQKYSIFLLPLSSLL